MKDFTLEQAKEIAEQYLDLRESFCDEEPSRPIARTDSAWQIGQAYHIRTVTHYWTGRLVAVTPQELVLEDAAWIANTGRFTDFFSDGPDEVEPVDGPVIIGRGAVIDAQIWTIALPRSQK